MRVDVLGVGFDSMTAEEAVTRALGALRDGAKTYIVTPNPEIVWMAHKDPSLRSSVNNAGLVLPDGVGIIMAARILGTPLLKGRITGIDFTEALLGEMAQSGGRVFLLGAKPGVAEEAGRRLAEKYCGMVVSGVQDGYFTDDGPIVEQINNAHPDLLLVCLGAPKQELWMAENTARLDAPLCIGLGGALDVYAGKVRRAPAAFRKLGLEWFYRLIREPRRIKRMIKLPVFLLAVIWKRIKR